MVYKGSKSYLQMDDVGVPLFQPTISHYIPSTGAGLTAPLSLQAEDPSLTQPLSQRRMKEHLPVSQQYSELLVETGTLGGGVPWPWGYSKRALDGFCGKILEMDDDSGCPNLWQLPNQGRPFLLFFLGIGTECGSRSLRQFLK